MDFHKHVKNKYTPLWEKKIMRGGIDIWKSDRVFLIKKIVNIPEHLDLGYSQKHSKTPFQVITYIKSHKQEIL